MKELDTLVRDSIAGDRHAFAALLETETVTAYRAALAILRSPDDARDAVQDAAVIAWQRLPELRNPAAWPPWFRRIAVRVALDERRHVRRTRDVHGVADPPLDRRDPMAGTDDRVVVLAALSRLPPADRALLGLRYGADLSVPDVAAALGLRLGTAKARLHRVLRTLRTELGDVD